MTDEINIYVSATHTHTHTHTQQLNSLSSEKLLTETRKIRAQ